MAVEPTAELRGGIERILGARSAVVVGASERRGPQRAAIDNLVGAGVPAWGVNPTRREVRGLPCMPSCADLPERPDLAILLVGHSRILAAAEDALEAGVGGLVVPGLGLEAGLEARAVAEEVAALAERAGVPVVGTNCMGLALPGGASAWVGTLGRDLLPGRVTALVQSGSVGEALCALGPRIGFRCIASLGTELTRDVADWCAAAAGDEGTEAVGLFLETVRRPAALRRALELLCEAGKPVVCLRVGRSPAGARAAVAHTDAVLTPERAFAALARGVGLIEVSDFSELVESLELLGRRRPRGARIAAVTQSGGEAALIGDMAAAAGEALPDYSPALKARVAAELPAGFTVQNPLDAWTIDDTAGVYRRVFEAIAASGEYDALLLQLDQSPFVGELEREVAGRLAGELAAATAGTGAVAPVLLSMNASEPTDELRDVASSADIPLLRGSAAAIRSLVKVAGWKGRARPADVPEPLEPLALPHRDLGELEAAVLLRAVGVRFTPHRGAADAGEAVEAARELGYPVVVKADEAGHRSASSGVELGLVSDEEVASAAKRIGGRLVVAQQVPSAPELYCGGRVQDGYGPIVCVGWGGNRVERASVVACSLAPLGREAVLDLLADVPGLVDACGEEMLEELGATVTAISRLVAALPEGASFDVNPILLSERYGPTAVDALLTGLECANN